VKHEPDGSIRQPDTVSPATVDWSLLSSQGHVLFYIALCPDCTAKEIARAIGRTERQTWRIIQSLKGGAMLHLRKSGRRHHFTVNFEAPLLHPTIQDLSLRALMEGAVEQVRSQTPDICEKVQA
jgi:hypothetical protein